MNGDGLKAEARDHTKVDRIKAGPDQKAEAMAGALPVSVSGMNMAVSKAADKVPTKGKGDLDPTRVARVRKAVEKVVVPRMNGNAINMAASKVRVRGLIKAAATIRRIAGAAAAVAAEVPTDLAVARTKEVTAARGKDRIKAARDPKAEEAIEDPPATANGMNKADSKAKAKVRIKDDTDPRIVEVAKHHPITAIVTNEVGSRARATDVLPAAVTVDPAATKSGIPRAGSRAREEDTTATKDVAATGTTKIPTVVAVAHAKDIRIGTTKAGSKVKAKVEGPAKDDTTNNVLPTDRIGMKKMTPLPMVGIRIAKARAMTTTIGLRVAKVVVHTSTPADPKS